MKLTVRSEIDMCLIYIQSLQGVDDRIANGKHSSAQRSSHVRYLAINLLQING